MHRLIIIISRIHDMLISILLIYLFPFVVHGCVCYHTISYITSIDNYEYKFKSCKFSFICLVPSYIGIVIIESIIVIFYLCLNWLTIKPLGFDLKKVDRKSDFSPKREEKLSSGDCDQEMINLCVSLSFFTTTDKKRLLQNSGDDS